LLLQTFINTQQIVFHIYFDCKYTRLFYKSLNTKNYLQIIQCNGSSQELDRPLSAPQRCTAKQRTHSQHPGALSPTGAVDRGASWRTVNEQAAKRSCDALCILQNYTTDFVFGLAYWTLVFCKFISNRL